jgi:translation elongation factor EF-4
MAKILTNEEYVGGILKLVEDKRGGRRTSSMSRRA